MYKQGQVRLIKTHLPLSLLPPEMLNKCRWSKSLYFVRLTGLSGLVQGCLFVLWRRWISISHSMLWLWTLISITHSMPSGQGCVRWAEPKGRGSVLLPPPPAHQVLQFAICLCNLFYNLLFVCKCFPYRSAHPQLQFPDFLKLFMANLLVQVKFSCMKTQSFISNTFLLFRVPTWPTWRKDLTRAVLVAFFSSGTRIWRPTFPTPSGRKRTCWRKNIQGAYDVQNDDGVLGDLPDWGAGDLLGGPAEHQEDEVEPGRQPCRPACQVRIHFCITITFSKMTTNFARFFTLNTIMF